MFLVKSTMATESGLITHHSTIFNLKTSVKTAPKLKRRVFDYFDGLRATLEALELCTVIESEVRKIDRKTLFTHANPVNRS